MSKSISAFSLIPDQSEIWSAQKASLRCTALRLRDGTLCLYSPVLGLGDIGKNSLAALDDVSYLLAPNHYHHKGLNEYAEAFPKAKLVCSERAQPRLEKQTGLSFEGFQTLEPLLPEGYEIAEPSGLKTGEVWIVAEIGSEMLWIVCDSFKGPSGKVGSVGNTVELLGTFPIYGIQDKDVYAEWVKEKTTTAPPTMIVPCHGSIIQSNTLPSDIVSLLRA